MLRTKDALSKLSCEKHEKFNVPFHTCSMSIHVNPLIVRDARIRVHRYCLYPLHVHPKRQQPMARRNWHLRDPLHKFTRFSFFLFFPFFEFRREKFFTLAINLIFLFSLRLFSSLILTHIATRKFP